MQYLTDVTKDPKLKEYFDEAAQVKSDFLEREKFIKAAAKTLREDSERYNDQHWGRVTDRLRYLALLPADSKDPSLKVNEHNQIFYNGERKTHDEECECPICQIRSMFE